MHLVALGSISQCQPKFFSLENAGHQEILPTQGAVTMTLKIIKKIIRNIITLKII